MVTCSLAAALLAQAAGAEEKKLPIQRLDPETRTKVMMALVGLVLLWFLVVVLIMLAGRWTRSYVNQPPRLFRSSRRPPPDPDDWSRKPLRPDDDPPSDESDN